LGRNGKAGKICTTLQLVPTTCGYFVNCPANKAAAPSAFNDSCTGLASAAAELFNEKSPEQFQNEFED
jgi:hypothetical protein